MPHFTSYFTNSSHAPLLFRKLRFLRLTAAQLKQLHSQLTVSGAIGDPFYAATLGPHFAVTDFHHARALLRLAPLPAWNSAIRSLFENHHPHIAVSISKEMVRSGFLPDKYTFSFVFRACAEILHVDSALMYHCLVVKLGWERYDYVQNGLIHCYASCGSMEVARKLFDWSPNRDVITWTAVVNGYLKVGQIDAARELFDKMPERNAVSWSAMINGYAQMGMFVDALETFNRMLTAGIRPNHQGVVGALSACGNLGAIVQGRWIHAYIDRSGMEVDTALGTALVDMYAKCGCIDAACDIFEKIPRRDVYAYTSLIMGLANHGESAAALKLFKRMEGDGVCPNEITFISVLTACSRIGLVEEGLRIFGSMKDLHGVIPRPQHFGCLVDLLGRAGLLKQAAEVVSHLPVESDLYTLGALLNACRVHGDVKLGKTAVEGLSKHSLDHSGVRILLSNIYASLEKWNDAERVRSQMVEERVEKVAGYSLLEVDSEDFEYVLNATGEQLQG